MEISKEKKISLEKQGYRIVGNHSAIKVCLWTKKSLKCQDVCYKNTFYGIKSWQCVQMTPALPYCTHRCVFCWRDIEFTSSKWDGSVDSPKDIVDGCIDAHTHYIQGFGGNDKVDKKRLTEGYKPLHFAISLSGEPTMYPRLPELIDEIKSRGMTSFLVTNGTNPSMLKKLVGHEPTQLYLTLPAPDEQCYLKTCAPIENGAWSKIMESLLVFSFLKNTRRTIRMTLAKEYNMVHPEKYAQLFKTIDSEFFELKAYMWVGYSRTRLAIENMPFHEEIVEFANKIIEHYPALKIIDQKKESRVVLLAKNDMADRIMKFD